ncbi:MAG: T9SS type A sorting domain-containing protein [Cyclobacteriaceae bacterium]
MGFQYFNSRHSITAVDATLDYTSSQEYWDTTISGTTPQANIALFWKDGCSSNITDVTSGSSQLLFVSSLNGTNWTKKSSTINTGSLACDNSTPASETGSISATMNSFGSYTFGFLNSILAIKLISFSSENLKDKVKLNWVTAEESGVDFFRIEHSTDGINFKSIGELKAAGNGSRIVNYSLDHSFPSRGLNYYKLVEFELNKEKINHGVITVDYSGSTQPYQMYPNPIAKEEDLNFWISETDDSARLEFYDFAGQLISIVLKGGENKIDLIDFKPGIYIFKIITSSGVSSGRLVVK